MTINKCICFLGSAWQKIGAQQRIRKLDKRNYRYETQNISFNYHSSSTVWPDDRRHQKQSEGGWGGRRPSSPHDHVPLGHAWPLYQKPRTGRSGPRTWFGPLYPPVQGTHSSFSILLKIYMSCWWLKVRERSTAKISKKRTEICVRIHHPACKATIYWYNLYGRQDEPWPVCNCFSCKNDMMVLPPFGIWASP